VREGRAGEQVFNQRRSLFFKNVLVRRIVDEENATLLYVSYARELADGSAKMGISTVPLTDADLDTLE